MHPSLQAPADRRVYTITQLTREIKSLLESTFPVLWVEGEISNLKKHASGHMYFVLKDEQSQLPTVMWRSRNQHLIFAPADGMKVLAQGCVSVYERRGQYQFETLQMQPAGIGQLQLAFEQLKTRLRQEGLFAQELKKPLPRYPERIGVITSESGAAIRDLTSVFARRAPGIQLILKPVLVQGAGASEEIARAVDLFNRFGEVDLLILCRGGGSLEDLWPFNEEIVARAIHRSRLPVISAVGHEVDFCISDFVADVRAPTPSAAAEIAAPGREELAETIQSSARRISQQVGARMALLRDKIGHLQSSYALRRPVDLLRQQQQRLDDLSRSAERQFAARFESSASAIKNLRRQLIALSPRAVLSRGYSLCFDDESGDLIKTARDTAAGKRVRIQFHLGRALARVDRTEEDDGGDPEN